MKNVLSVLVALAFALSLSAVALAQEKGAATKPAGPSATAPQKAADPVKEAAPAKKAAKKAKAHQITGTVEAIDAAAGTLTVKGKRATLSLKAGEKAKLDGIKKGDKVLVRYTGDTAVSVKKVKGAAMKSRTKKAAKKKGEAKKEEPMKKDAAAAPPAEKK